VWMEGMSPQVAEKCFTIASISAGTV
jgi:hypothetical protein